MLVETSLPTYVTIVNSEGLELKYKVYSSEPTKLENTAAIDKVNNSYYLYYWTTNGERFLPKRADRIISKYNLEAKTV